VGDEQRARLSEIAGTPYCVSGDVLKQSVEIAERVSKLRNAGRLDAIALQALSQFFKIRNIYESNAIEGNQLDVGETRLVVEQGITLAGKSLKDQSEAKNLSAALDLLSEMASAEARAITENEIRQLHTLVLRDINDEYAGRYRDIDVVISGSKFSVKPPIEVLPAMHEFSSWLAAASMPHDKFASADGLLRSVAAHTWFVTIHPFVDGNGRVARMLTNLMLARFGFPIAIISTTDRSRYYDALEESQSTDLSAMTQLAMECVLESLEEYERIASSQQERIAFAQTLAEKLSEPQKLAAAAEYEVWKSAMELFKGFFRQTALDINQQSPFGARVYVDDFGELDYDKYVTLRAGNSAKKTWFFRLTLRTPEKASRYLFFFGHASYELRSLCPVTAFVAKERGSYEYHRVDLFSPESTPDLSELGYRSEEERFVAKSRTGDITYGRAEELGRAFITEAVAKF
jgi:Fic family protein